MALVLIGAPIDSVGRGGGAELGPVALRELGLAETLGASDRGDLEIRIRGDDRDPETGLIAVDDVLAATAEIRSAVAEAVAGGDRPLVLGGCCSELPAQSAAPATPSARSALPTSTAMPTSTTGRRRPPARPPTWASR